jgi:hypothetical protein
MIRDFLFFLKKNVSKKENVLDSSSKCPGEINSEIREILTKIVSDNINHPKFKEISNLILNGDIHKAKIESGWHKSGSVKIVEDIIDFSRFYINNYGDSGEYDGVMCYDIHIPGYDNGMDLDNFNHLFIDGVRTDISGYKSLRRNKEYMLISEDEFTKIYKSVNRWISEQREKFILE